MDVCVAVNCDLKCCDENEFMSGYEDLFWKPVENYLGCLRVQVLQLQHEVVPDHAEVGEVFILALEELLDGEIPLALLGEGGQQRAGFGRGADRVVDRVVDVGKVLWGGVDRVGPVDVCLLGVSLRGVDCFPRLICFGWSAFSSHPTGELSVQLLLRQDLLLQLARLLGETGLARGGKLRGVGKEGEGFEHLPRWEQMREY